METEVVFTVLGSTSDVKGKRVFNRDLTTIALHIRFLNNSRSREVVDRDREAQFQGCSKLQ